MGVCVKWIARERHGKVVCVLSDSTLYLHLQSCYPAFWVKNV